MYCANCGSLIKPELNYCSRCGMRVAKIDSENANAVCEGLSASLGYVGGFGFVGFIFVALILVKNGVHPTALTFISFFYLAALVGVCFLILEQIRAAREKSTAEKINFQSDFQTVLLNAPNTAQLEEPKQQPISVTENTTRTLDEVLVERK